MAYESTVVRDGVRGGSPARELVPGDVVVLDPGDKVPADCRLLAARGLFVDEALLTGESVPMRKRGRAAAGGDAAARAATWPTPARWSRLVRDGWWLPRPPLTTELGRISELVGTADPLTTPLTRKIAAFSRTLTFAILALAGLTFALAWLRGYAPLDGFLAAVALAVAAIPEGLPAIMTIALATGVRRMATRNTVVRRLPAVETLGSTTVICSDKTGTLTRGEMVAVEAFAGDRVEITGAGYAPDGAFLDDGRVLERPSFEMIELLEAALLCSDARVVLADGAWRVEGDPTEGALVAAAAKAGIERAHAERRRPRLDALPFESERRFMATLHAGAAGGPWSSSRELPRR